jgi:uncharacterized glyoxalase superfamily protein PhnB
MSKTTIFLAIALCAASLVSSAEEKNSMSSTVKRVTPVLFVDNVEPCLKFWEQLGFQRAMEVPDGASLAFAAVQKDGVEVMYQTIASAMKDPSASAATKERLRSHAFLFVEIADLAPVLAALKGTKLEVEKHETFYGSQEIVVRDPGGHFVTFAEFPKK